MFLKNEAAEKTKYLNGGVLFDLMIVFISNFVSCFASDVKQDS